MQACSRIQPHPTDISNPLLTHVLWLFVLRCFPSLQSFFMGLMFLLSGYFSTPSYNKKGPLRFLADRALRLVLPLLTYDLFLQPLTFEIARHSPAAPKALRAASNGFSYYFNTQFIRVGHGAAWFIAVLFVFDVIYAAVRVVMHCFSTSVPAVPMCRPAPTTGQCIPAPEQNATQADPDDSADCTAVVSPFATAAANKQELPVTQPRPQPALQAFSAGMTTAGVFVTGAVITGLCLMVRLGVLMPLNVPLSGWTLDGIQFQPTYLPQYVAAFVLGLVAYSAPDGLQRLPTHAGLAAAVVAAVLAVVGGVIMTYFPGTNFGQGLFAEPSMAYVAVYTIWEQFYAVFMWLAMLVIFREYVNKKGGKFGSAVSGASYAVYVIHVPIVTSFGVALTAVAWPAAAKCAVMVPMVLVSCWILGMLLKLVPGVKQVL